MLVSYSFTEEQFKNYFMVLFKQQITLSGADSITYEDMSASVSNSGTDVTWDNITVSCEVPEYVSTTESTEPEEPNEGGEGNEGEGENEGSGEEENNGEGGGE